MTISNSVINGNTGRDGGGIFSTSALDISDSTISGNRASVEGGGIRCSGTFSNVTRSRILNNSAIGGGGGGIYSLGNLTVLSSTISGNSADTGGGVSNDGGGYISDSTINNNTANGGGGLYSRANLQLVNVTISRNHAAFEGGGLNVIDNTYTFYSTISFNTARTGAGVFVPSGNLLSISTIFSGNLRNDTFYEDIFGTIISGGYNLIESTLNTTIQGNPSGNIIGQSARLDPVLRNNGGLTHTHALRLNSPAIDAGRVYGTVLVTSDQRGKIRPYDFPSIPNAPGSDGSDIGAFERQANDISSRTLFDFDGDGRSDVSVFRPSNSVWYLQQSQNGFAATVFGLSNDKIVPADYDGDGKTDIATYRNGVWYLQRSTAGFAGITFGLVDDIPVPADYDGDGLAEIAVFRPSNGVWYFLNLANNQSSAVQFGTTGDKPVAADFDGDGETDIAVYRGGIWYILRSSDNQLQIGLFRSGN